MKRLISALSLVTVLSTSLSAQLLYNRSNESFNDEILLKPTKKQYIIADEYWINENYDFALKIYRNIKANRLH